MDNFQFTVEPFSEDVTGHLSWGVLGNQLLRVANLSASKHDFGFSNVAESHYAWVLSRLIIEVGDMPQTGADYSINTWVSRVYRQFTDRLFSLSNAAGEPFGYAHSIWALIDLETRQPADIEHMADSAIAKAAEPYTIPISSVSRVKVAQTEPVRILKAAYGDLDINGHVNSIRYLQATLDTLYDCFAAALNYERHRVRRVEISYSKELYFGDNLFFYAQQEDELTYAAEIKTDQNVVATKVKVFFEPVCK